MGRLPSPGSACLTMLCSPHSQVLPDLAQQDPDGMDLLSQLLTYDPAARITARRALRHPFFAQCVREEAAGGGAGEAAEVGPLTVESEGVTGCCAAEANAAAVHGCDAPPIPAATAAKPPLPHFAPSKRQCLRSALLPCLPPDDTLLPQVVTCIASYSVRDSSQWILSAGSGPSQTALTVH